MNQLDMAALGLSDRFAALTKEYADLTVGRILSQSYKKLQRELSYSGLNARQLEHEKINRMFGGKSKMKQAMKYFREKNNR